MANMCKLNGSAHDVTLYNITLEIIEAVDYVTPISFVGSTFDSLPDKIKVYYEQQRLKKLNDFFNLHKAQFNKSTNLEHDRLVEDIKQKRQEFEMKDLCDEVKLKTSAIIRKMDETDNEMDSSGLNIEDWKKTKNYLLCVVWDLLHKKKISSIERYNLIETFHASTPMALGNLMDTFAEYVIYILAKTVGSTHVSHRIDTLTDLIWKYRLVSFDRFILSLVLRPLENNQSEVLSDVTETVIQMIMLKNTTDFLKMCKYWTEDNSCTSRNNREYHEIFRDTCQWERPDLMPLPNYYNNVCLRFIPVLDVLYCRLISNLQVGIVNEQQMQRLTQLGHFYKLYGLGWKN